MIMNDKVLWWPSNYATAYTILSRAGYALPRRTLLEGLPIFVARSDKEALGFYKESLGGLNPANDAMVALVSNYVVSCDIHPGRFGSRKVEREAYQWAAEEPLGLLRKGTGWVL
jgi:hypothetical protein